MKVFIVIVLAFLFGYSGLAQTKAKLVESSENAINPSRTIKVFPNPATNVINILGLENSNRAEISISDVYGNKVLVHQWKIRNNALNIPISTLNPGLYLITIHSPEQNIKKKFYKQ